MHVRELTSAQITDAEMQLVLQIEDVIEDVHLALAAFCRPAAS